MEMALLGHCNNCYRCQGQADLYTTKQNAMYMEIFIHIQTCMHEHTHTMYLPISPCPQANMQPSASQ